MTRRRAWNEESLSETPAVELLQALGYTFVPAATLATERTGLQDPILPERLARALRRLNPWLSDDNVQRAIRALTSVQATSLLEAGEALHTIITRGTTAEQDRDDAGRGHHTVRFIDFDDLDANEWIVTRQFEVKGSRVKIIPDIVLFVNGIPLVVIECKSPTLGTQWSDEAIDQLRRYQELDDKHRGRGAPRLFHTVQLTVATCDQAALYGTVGTPARFYAAWKEPYPLTLDALARELGRPPSAQEILFHGMLARKNLLDLVRHFVVFERDARTHRTIRKVARYQQYTAVNKAMARAATPGQPEDRGGVVWHTQGSGKSLTMLWLALKLRHDPTHENPTIVLVTDRRDLDEQIARTFVACGYPNPERANSIRELRELLRGPGGRTVMTTVHKFQEAGGVVANGTRLRKVSHPELSDASNIFVLTDEAHRTQYGSLAANLRAALPNAVFFAFTGTPIDKDDRSTQKTFGPYIDRYTIEQSVADGATVPIYYESRLPELRIIGQSLDKVFERVFADRTPEEREAIKKRHATAQAVAEAPRRIMAICLDIVEHMPKAVERKGFKAQIVAVSRDAAVTYKEMLDAINGSPSAVIFSGSNDDTERLARHHTTADERKELIRRFLDGDDDDLAILIVCDMLITGFDAPVEQIMYLDSPLKEHTLLQAIARVNRPADGKIYGLVVDYWGVSEALQEALAVFAPGDVKKVMEPKTDELPRLQARHAAAMRFFARVTARDDLNACVSVLEPEDVRAEFQAAFRRLCQSMDMLMPDPRALAYSDDVAWLGKIRQAARARFRDATLDIGDVGDKVRTLIEEAIVADGVQVLVKEVSLFSADFDAKLAALAGEDARASEMEHAIRHEIHVKLEEDPVFYQSLRERLEQIIEDRKAQRMDAARQLELFESMRRELRGRDQAAESVGLSEAGFAVYGLLAGTASGELDEATRELAGLIDEAVEPSTKIIDWVRKDDVQREMRRQIKRRLKAAKVAPERIDDLAAAILDVYKARRGR